MTYLTHRSLMRESEDSVQHCADDGPEPAQHICSTLLASVPRYQTWISTHDRRMDIVARGKSRERQIVSLRLVATEQIHRQALVRYLRDNNVTGVQRQLVLREFYGPLESECAVLAEHRQYTQAVSSHICATDLLELCADRHGVAMIEAYESEYGIYFAMHCDRARAWAQGRRYLLKSLVPEIKARADALRTQLLTGDRLPAPPIRVSVSATGSRAAIRQPLPTRSRKPPSAGPAALRG